MDASRVPEPHEQVKVLVDQMEDPMGDGGIAAEFVCKICLVNMVGREPKLTSCSHLFCGDCIATWFSVHPGNQTWANRMLSKGRVPCPVCKEPLHPERDLHAVRPDGEGGSSHLWKLLAETKIVCANHRRCRRSGRCDWVGTYGSYPEHLKECRAALGDGPEEAVAAFEEPGAEREADAGDAGNFSPLAEPADKDLALDDFANAADDIQVYGIDSTEEAVRKENAAEVYGIESTEEAVRKENAAEATSDEVANAFGQAPIVAGTAERRLKQQSKAKFCKASTSSTMEAAKIAHMAQVAKTQAAQVAQWQAAAQMMQWQQASHWQRQQAAAQWQAAARWQMATMAQWKAAYAAQQQQQRQQQQQQPQQPRSR
jgi:hypothetical protein